MTESEKERILIVDDRAENLLAMETLLEEPGLEIVTASSGQEALWQILQYDFALILLDVQMPDMDGFETAQLIRRRGKTKHVPLIFVTAINKEQKHIFKGYESGAVDYLFKPLEPEILKAKVQVFLELHRQNKLIVKQAEELRESEEKFRSISVSAHDAFVLVDNDGSITYWNRSAGKIFGFEPREIIGKNLNTLIPEKYHDTFSDGFKRFRATGRGDIIGKVIEMVAIKKDGMEFPIELSVSAIKMKGKWGAVGIIRDITKRKVAEQRLEYLALFDLLTGLPNRIQFFDRLDHVRSFAGRDNDLFALLFMDLDRFKDINDTFGHDVGDLLLKEVARRLTACVRESDTVARMGGDEFTVILARVKDEHDATIVARNIIDSINKPFYLSGHECLVSVSVGISMYPADGDNAEVLLSNADIAMYAAKKEARKGFRFYTYDMNVRTLERLTMEHDLRGALERHEFLLYYQPQVALQTMEIIGIEALVRWQHPEMGLILPGKFIPVAEETGLIVDIEDWVMRTACVQHKAWREQGLPCLRVAVNTSAYRFRREFRHDMITDVLKETGLPPECLEVEMTETLLMQNLDTTVVALKKLRDMGVHLSIDDFGTGYSSMSYLKHLPIYKLKIDQSFIKDITDNPDDLAIVTAIITMGHSLHLKVIAEGVEDEKQMELLRSLGCDEIQGFVISKPLPGEEVELLLSNWNKTVKPCRDGSC